MPNYVKFLKDILTKKRRLGEFETVALTESCSAILKNKIPPKLKDPGSITIPCSIGGRDVDRDVPIILGMPFLAIGRTLIDVQKWELTMRVNDQQVTFNVFNAMKFLNEIEECSRLSVIESIVAEKFHKEAFKDGMGVRSHEELEDLSEREESQVTGVESKQPFAKFRRPFESLNFLEENFKPPKPSIQEPPKLELKPLLRDLEYAYLRDNETLHVIISVMLGAEKESLLLAVLKKYTRAIGWTMADIKGISPSFFMHKILLEDFCNNFVEQQQRLNPIMKEVVRKEIIKWLDYGIVYPISDSSWKDAVWVVQCSRHFPTLYDGDIFRYGGKSLEVFMDDFLVFALKWSLPFELMCDASEFAVGAVLGQRKEKIFHSIYYASKTLADAQLNYTTTEKELLAVVFAFDKFEAYLVGTKVVVYTDHSDRKGTENQVADHLSRIEAGSEKQNEGPIKETFFNEQLLVVNQVTTPWYTDFVNYLVSGFQPPNLNRQQLKKLFHDVRFYYWDEPYFYKQCPDQIMRRCVLEDKVSSILEHCHSAPYGGHFGWQRTATKVFQSGYYWPSIFKDAHEFSNRCDHCQRVGNILARSDMPLNSILEVELFDVWGIDFMGPFPQSFGNLYILVAVDYVS
ncbi:uncharacterized protein LOC133825338 [Humulus lupulus]|uniref:uncharacterized protein LOC133825338 n=1 Tax=Humulus lupulus TaxID=3486 RepID=UPI002B40D43A|nr:uncharacterized protein LOC133825338 [Humulus lupulus]